MVRGVLLLAACGTAEPIAEPPVLPAPHGCVEDVSAGVHVHPCEGLRFTVSVPERCTTGGCGAILDIHGGTMSADMEDANTSLRALGDRNGYIVVQPSVGEPPLAFWESTHDDDVMSFLESVILAFGADEDRIHSTGFSQGGAMTWRLLCDYGDRFASVAPAAEAPPCPFAPPARTNCFHGDDDVPRHPIPILYMHGRFDGIVPFECGETAVRRAIAGFRLTSSSTVTSSERHIHTRHTGEGILEFIRHDYRARPSSVAELIVGNDLEGHCFPGSRDLDGTASGQLFGFACDGETDFHWGEQVIAFFMAHPRR